MHARIRDQCVLEAVVNSAISLAGSGIDRSVVKILIGVHGYEREGYGRAVSRAVALWSQSMCRVVAVFDMWVPPFTSLLPAGRETYNAAASHHLRDEHDRVERVVSEVAEVLPDSTEIIYVTVRREDPARVITHHSRLWSADAIVVSPAGEGLETWLWPGAVHERVVQSAPCPVVLASPPVAQRDVHSGLASLLRPLFQRRSGQPLHRVG
jgi:nucleotide-binding universal stress UspA family protein